MSKYSYCFLTGVNHGTTNESSAIHYPDGTIKQTPLSDLLPILNELGNDGWEMVTCGVSTFPHFSHTIYFRKKIGQ
jgi:hypothetical protein